jgi:hypothetical protein
VQVNAFAKDPADCQRATASCSSDTKKTCCKSGAIEASARRAPSDSEDTGDSSPHVIILRALACQGQSPSWLAAVPTMVYVTPVISGDVPPAAWINTPLSEAAMSNTVEPTDPPPEAA